MKRSVKMFTVNDGYEMTNHNGQRLFVESFPRTEIFIAAFLENDYELISRTPVYNPSIQRKGVYSFYRGGWNFVFSKELAEGESDNGDAILQECIRNASVWQDQDFEQDFEEEYIEDEEEG